MTESCLTHDCAVSDAARELHMANHVSRRTESLSYVLYMTESCLTCDSVFPHISCRTDVFGTAHELLMASGKLVVKDHKFYFVPKPIQADTIAGKDCLQ